MNFFFMFLSFSRVLLSNSHKILNYWDNNQNLGFYDSRGNIFTVENNKTVFQKRINPFVKDFKSVMNYSCTDFISKTKPSSLIEYEKNKLQFFWNDTTLYHTIFPDHTFFRLNYFGEYFLLKQNFLESGTLSEYKNEKYLQYASSFQKFLITIDSFNELNFYLFEKKKFIKLYSHFLFYQDILKKVEVQKVNNYIYMNLFYKDNTFKCLTFFHDESKDTFRYLHQNDIIIRDSIIDFHLQFPYIYILTKNNIQCFLLKTFDNFSQMVFKRYINHNYESLYFFKEKLYLSGEKNIDFFDIKKN